jgi:LmbE family N-acetylglucosaminyl deacetylase
LKIMAIGPHPDDIEYYCAGTLAKYKAEGHDIAIVCMTNGEVGSQKLTKQKTGAIRRKEAEEAADILGVKFFWLGYPDEFLFNTPEVRLNIIEVIRQFDPDIIITSDKDLDSHPDHTTTGKIIWDVHVMCAVNKIETKTKACSKIPEIFFMDTIVGVNFEPEIYVDITDYWDIKEEMLKSHNSQAEFLMDLYGMSMIENCKLQCAFRGLQSGCKYAETFRKPKFYPQKANSGFDVMAYGT